MNLYYEMKTTFRGDTVSLKPVYRTLKHLVGGGHLLPHQPQLTFDLFLDFHFFHNSSTV